MAKKTQRQIAEDWFFGIMKDMEAGKEGHQKMLMTPDIAAVLLENNKNNRSLRENRVNSIAVDIREGRWKRNGQTISIADTGDLNDGQHRLHGIVRAGLPVELDVIWGISRDSRDTVDVGNARTAADMVKMTGNHANAAVMAAIARQVISYENFQSLSSLSRISTPQVVDRCNTDEDLRMVASWAAWPSATFRIMVAASTAGAAFYLLHKADPQRAKTFMDRLRDGEHLSKTSPIHMLRERLTVERKHKPQIKMELIFKTWNSWMLDEDHGKRIVIDGKLPKPVTRDIVLEAQEKAKAKVKA